MIKQCKDCGIDLIIPDTWTEALQRGRSYRCKPCYSKFKSKTTAPKYRAKNREKAAEATREWRKNNPDKYQEILNREREQRKSKEKL